MEVSRGASHVYGIERHTLCLAAVAGDTTSNRFVLGTLGVTEPAEIHLVDFNSDEGTLQSLVYKHEGGARALASASWDPTQLLVVGRDNTHAIGSAPSVELVELPGISPQEKFPSQESMLEQSARRIALLSDASTEPQPSPHEIICHSAAHCRQVATVASTGVGIWTFTQSAPSLVHIISAAQNSMEDIGTAAWHPTATTQLLTTDGMCVRSWDMRADTSSHQTMSIDYAHSGKVRSLDYNPNLPYIIATGGDDGSVRIWDTRNPSSELMSIANHTHWVYSVAFNPNHDQLLLSAGGDGLVNLESTVSVSSAQVVTNADSQDGLSDKGDDEGSNIDDEEIGKPSDGLVAQFDDHETSVYAACWSAADPWLFASLSFDGRMVINTVPQEEKYRILL
ncbi:WD40 repeat-like protein [Coemansia reversa NRRL 1564]|uniref:WD40 repeat-like protein n=1 Tax=Coemansia reversa (strain ATCC 12441 / NRRL 1564) TaxID=763665 RepID=A0A2G5BIP3_COERN|nr:WD40 repeat-like protein [Coemansia reversa NRRL 1564]|eukprot:PIA18873.1 WD40 repeat-like protein [Coemansia reversa NRRL 1564]